MWAKYKQHAGFTIVELLIVIVVIGILAAIIIVAFNGVQGKAHVAAAQSAATQAFKKVQAYYVVNGAYPSSLADVQVVNSGSTTYTYIPIHSGEAVCVSAQDGTAIYSAQNTSTPVQGGCGQVIASYYANNALSGEPTVQRSEDAMQNTWGLGSPDSSIPTDNFSAQWKSKIIPPVTGAYTFYTNTDDYSQLIVDGATIIDWTPSGVRDATSTTVNLTANQPVTVTYSMKESGGNAYATLYWSYPGVSKVVVPSSTFIRI